MLIDGKGDSLSKCSERREVSEVDNKAVVRRWIETFNNPYTPQTEVDVLAPGYVAHAPGLPGPLDLEAWSQFTATFVEAFPDLRLTVEDIFSEGDMVAARVAFRGTHRGEFQGIPPTGKEVAFSSMVFNHVVDGRVEEHWFEMDLLGLMGQLGAIPEPEQSEEANPT
jgi:predicted ester cyclase